MVYRQSSNFYVHFNLSNTLHLTAMPIIIQDSFSKAAVLCAIITLFEIGINYYRLKTNEVLCK